jgi:hypothetical protein
MKKSVLLVVGILMGSQAYADQNCRGVQDIQGVRAELGQVGRQTFALTYTVPSMGGPISRVCTFVPDRSYRPATPNPRKDRYILDQRASIECRAKYVWVSKTLLTQGRGHVEVEFRCLSGGRCPHGEPGSVEAFRCEL